MSPCNLPPFLPTDSKVPGLHLGSRSVRRQQTSANAPHIFSLLSLTEAFRVIWSEFDGAGQLSDDVGVAHQLGKHVAVPHDIRIHIHAALWRRQTVLAEASSGQTE